MSTATALGFTDRTFDFFAGLEQDNSKDYVDAHRDVYKAEVQAPFIALLEAVTERLAGTDIPLRGGRATTFRLNRDVRFSKDKSPYSTSESGLLTPSGTKSEAEGVLYIAVDAEGGMAIAGFYKLSPKQLKPIRQRIVEEDERFDGILGDLQAAGYVLNQADMLTGMPRGFEAHADHPHADVIRMQTISITENLEPAALVDGSAVDRIAAFAQTAQPLLEFGRTA